MIKDESKFLSSIISRLSSGQSAPRTNCGTLYHKHKTDKKASVMHRYGIIGSMIGDNRSTVQTTLPEADLVRQQCQAAQARHHFFRGPTTPPADQPQPVVVAVSGGADSVALLHLLHSLASPWQIALQVAHVDHNLRPESAADAHFVAQLAAQWQLPFHLQQLAPTDLAESGEGIEAAGRRARYRFLTEVALTITPPGQIPVIALAHHADDQAETLLLHLCAAAGCGAWVGCVGSPRAGPVIYGRMRRSITSNSRFS